MEQGSLKGGLSTTLRFLDIPTEATKWSKFDFKSCSNQLSDSLLSSVSSVTLFLSKKIFFQLKVTVFNFLVFWLQFYSQFYIYIYIFSLKNYHQEFPIYELQSTKFD